ncbi:alpha/beta fold hydrolase [Rugosimonospora acidiphila]|uniref:Alpha/beta fold hydrolase n=1 Tax=Rugosimonospora acidiphila TaxID=556531 RepID=A0ABP9RYH4_9ACTN
MIALHRVGAGEPLLLLHGIGHRWQAWQPVLGPLAEHHDVLAVDLPGFGTSPLPDGPMDMPATVRRLGEFLDGLGVARPHVAGNSLGGAVALELAAHGLARSATALSPAGFTSAWELRWALSVLRLHRWLAARLPDSVVYRVARSPRLRALAFGMMVARPGRLDPDAAAGDARALRDGPGFATVAREARRYRFGGSPDVPVTVAWATRDRILLPRQARRAGRALPRARHVPLPGCGHLSMSDEPELVARVILRTTGALPAEGR